MGLYIILMGVQGAGKGEQAKFIQQTYGIPQVSTGDLFRAMRTRTDDLAQRVQATMAAGNLIDDDTTNEVLVDRLNQPDAANGVILDGYPRNAAQTAFLADYLKKKNEKITAAILLELDLYTAFKRAFGRVTDKPRNISYNYYYKRDGVEFNFEENTENPDKATRFPPRLVAKLQESGEVIERRPDDADAAAVVKRIDLYLADTMPLLPEFEKLGVLHKVNAEQSVEDVSAAIKALIDRVK